MPPIAGSRRFDSRVDALDEALPQTQCTRCGYDDCRRYAIAIDAGEAETNRCPPGGAEGLSRLSRIAGTAVQPLDPSCGAELSRGLAVIDENWCIGCALCLQACPVDAITGAAKLMHTVIGAHCTGCELCIPVCPVDCISMVDVTGDRTGWNAWTPAQAAAAKARYVDHRGRRPLHGADGVDIDTDGDSGVDADADADANADADIFRRRAAVATALARARARRDP